MLSPKTALSMVFYPFTTALLSIVTRVAIGFNDPKPARCSAMCTLDLSKTFDAINHTLLIDQISGSSLHSNVVRWLAAYIRHLHLWFC
jgi:hypothetical protein